jgi:glycolate oxidase
LTNQIYHQLKSVIDKERVLFSIEARIASSYDASRLSYLPAVLVKPINSKEVSDILRFAYLNTIPVYTRGAASSVTGSAVPIKGGIVLDLSLMNRIIEINPVNLNATIEPGVVVTDFQKEVEKQNLFYPPDPASADFCTIGGNVATAAGGLRCIKYGTTRDYILGLEVVLSDGRIIKTGRGTLKKVSGYDLTRLFVGSEGTLGVFTKIIVRLIPKPPAEATLLAFFDGPTKPLQLSLTLLDRGILPRALEFMDATSISAVMKYKPDAPIPPETKAMLLIEVDGYPQDVENLARQVEQYIQEAKPLGIIRAQDKNHSQKLWSIRKAISAALFSITAQKISEDISVPRASIIPILQTIKEIESTSGIPTATFGHLGDGNLHINFLVSTKEHENNLASALDCLFKRTIELGGTLSGEHGIGLTKAKYLPLEWGKDELEIFKALKQLFDPKNILNAGKIFG